LVFDEKDIPTFQQEKKEQAWIPDKDGFRQRAQDFIRPQDKGKKEVISIRRIEAQGINLVYEMIIYG
jgi:hypothetical protein